MSGYPTGPYRRFKAEAYADATGEAQTRYAILATCTSRPKPTVEHAWARDAWKALAAWTDHHTYGGYTARGHHSPGPPPHLDVELVSGGQAMERVLIVPAAALEGGS